MARPGAAHAGDVRAPGRVLHPGRRRRTLASSHQHLGHRIGGLEGLAKNLDRLNLKRRKAFYGDWWDEAAQWRSGGFDRLCGGVPGNPSTTEIAEAGITGTLFVNEILTVRPGTPLEFLAAVVQERVPLMADYGHRPTGLYEVLNNQHEVVMVWAADIASHVTYRQNRDTTRGLCDEGTADERITAWEQRSAEYVTGGDTHLMTPLPRTVYGPKDWEDASLENWLAAQESAAQETAGGSDG